MGNQVKRLAVVLLGAILMTLATALPANAGRICDLTGRCGHIIHDRYSQAMHLYVPNGFGCAPSWHVRDCAHKAVPRGAEAAWKDDDGYFVPRGWYGRQTALTVTGWSPWLPGPRWQKVNDLNTVRVQLARK